MKELCIVSALKTSNLRIVAAHCTMASGQRRGSTGVAADLQAIANELKARGAEVHAPAVLNMHCITALFTLTIQALADIKLTGEALKKKLVEELDRYLLSLPPESFGVTSALVQRPHNTRRSRYPCAFGD